MWSLLSSFLLQRKVFLYVNGFISEKFSCKYGVPQGSVLAPLLFIFFINNILDEPNPTDRNLGDGMFLFKFADDLSVNISAHNFVTLMTNTKNVCDKLTKWCNKLRLKINTDIGKSEILVHTFEITDDLSKMSLQGGEICYVTSSPVLGLTFDSKLTWQKHWNKIYASSIQKMVILKRNIFSKFGPKFTTIVLLFNTMVSSSVLYCSEVWSHNHLNKLNKLWYDFLKVSFWSPYNPEILSTEVLASTLPLNYQAIKRCIKFILINIFSSDDFYRLTIMKQYISFMGFSSSSRSS